MEALAETTLTTVRHVKLIPLILCLISLAGTARGQKSHSDFQYGPRPTTSVFDPAGILTLAQVKEISEPLEQIRKNENIDVLVVILPKIGDAPVEHVAKAFLDSWSLSRINAVVVHIPGQADSPHIFPGETMGRLIRPEAMRAAVESAEKRARAEPNPDGKIRAAAMEAADALRYWAGGAVLVTESIQNERLRRQLAFEKRQRLLKLAAVMGAAASIPLITGLIFLFLKMKNLGSRHFPQTRKLARLGAPYSGGNHAISKINSNP